jgi:hypothetical protein
MNTLGQGRGHRPRRWERTDEVYYENSPVTGLRGLFDLFDRHFHSQRPLFTPCSLEAYSPSCPFSSAGATPRVMTANALLQRIHAARRTRVGAPEKETENLFCPMRR